MLDQSGYLEYMQKALLVAVGGALLFTAPASAREHKLTVRRAKVEIRRAYINATRTHPQLVTVGRCYRTRTEVNCRVVERYDPGLDCFTSERWSTDGTDALQALDPADLSWGDCPDVVTLTPVDGQPTYDPPN
jgi:hypothetical protein